MNKEEVDRHLLILTEASVAFDASHLALQKAESQNIENREQVMLGLWRLAGRAERQYNATVAWLNEQNVTYAFDQQQERYIVTRLMTTVELTNEKQSVTIVKQLNSEFK